MVSKASDDLPEPLRPVITVSVLRGISTEMFFKLCWRAPRTVILLIAMGPYEPGKSTRTDLSARVRSYGGLSRGQCAALLRMLMAIVDAVNSAAKQGKCVVSSSTVTFLRGL